MSVREVPIRPPVPRLELVPLRKKNSALRYVLLAAAAIHVIASLYLIRHADKDPCARAEAAGLDPGRWSSAIVCRRRPRIENGTFASFGSRSGRRFLAGLAFKISRAEQRGSRSSPPKLSRLENGHRQPWIDSLSCSRLLLNAPPPSSVAER